LLLSEQLLTKQRFSMEEYFWPRLDSRDYPAVRAGMVRPRHVMRRGRHLYYTYPWGSSVLSIPFVAAARIFGLSTIAPDGRYDFEVEKALQRFSAAVLMASATALFYASARVLLQPGWSVLIALAGAFSTQVWSTASRSLQSHCWLVVLLSAALYQLLRASVAASPLRSVWLASLSALGFFVRPTAAFSILPIAVWVWLRDRRRASWFALTGLMWIALLVVLNLRTWHETAPHYYQSGARFRLQGLGVGLAATLVSPSRGLLVFVPLVLVVVYALARYWPWVRAKSLAMTAAAAISIHILGVSAYRNYTAGFSYGARYTTEIVPWWILLAILAARAVLDRKAGREGTVAGAPSGRRRVGAALVALATLWGIVLNGAGAVSEAGRIWNQRPVRISNDPMRIFDWKRPQFLCALFPSLLPPRDPTDRRRPADAEEDE
jgi:hypothetical protein